MGKTSLITKEYRLAYPSVFKPTAVFNSERFKYSLTLLIPKNANIDDLKNIIKTAWLEEHGENPKAWPKNPTTGKPYTLKEILQASLADGDLPKYADKSGLPGNWLLKASSNEDYKPEIVGPDAEPIMRASDFYPGCYARASIYAYAWEYMNRHGVSFILDGAQKTKDGESFSGKKAPGTTFSKIEIDEQTDSNNFSDDDDDIESMTF